MPNLPRLVAAGVICNAIAWMVVIWALFVEMWIHDRTSITVFTNRYGEFWPEFLMLTLAMIGLPVLLYEVDDHLRADD